jgi:gluconate 5-dehydrogenase
LSSSTAARWPADLMRSLFDLTGRVAIVTGGGSGIGLQMAEGLAEAGADLLLCARKADRCEAAADDLASRFGIRAIATSCDVSDPDQVEAATTLALAELGRIDVLFNNAGTSWVAEPEEMPLRGWQKVMDVNLTGSFLFAQAAGRAMIEQGGGKIVNVASIMGMRGALPEVLNTVAYNASKGGLIAFTQDLACKWARHGITVNALAPGWFPTELTEVLRDDHESLLVTGTPLGRLGGPDDLAGVAVFLASRASDYMTGHTLVVDGGWSAK